MKAWLADAAIMGGGWGLGMALVFGWEAVWAAFGGVLFGVWMASLAVWRRWPTIGRRRFSAKPS